ncbi:MAG: tryptophan synthase subunit alpha [Planctomycetes bacterium]|nr:tryptophan synthase subunit alpha [Planctomycetota bacterium]
MNSRLADTFARLRCENRIGLVTYTTAGDPDLERSAEILLSLEAAGASVLEVGVPFSDPVADGPVIQRAAERALAAGTTLTRVLAMIAGLRPHLHVPLVLFSYANPIFRLGTSRFTRLAADAGVDGVLVLDLPVEEAGEFRDRMELAGIDTIFLLSPTTSDERIRKAVAMGSGFLYAISRLGVTGARVSLHDGAGALVRRIRAHSHLPVALGFGISHPDHVREAGRWADAAVVGSSLVSVIAEAGERPDLVERVQQHVRWLRGECPGAAPETRSGPGAPRSR